MNRLWVPLPRALKAFVSAIVMPAKTKHSEMVRKAGMPIRYISSVAWKGASKRLGKNWKMTVAIPMMAVTRMRPFFKTNRTRS